MFLKITLYVYGHSRQLPKGPHCECVVTAEVYRPDHIASAWSQQKFTVRITQWVSGAVEVLVSWSYCMCMIATRNFISWSHGGCMVAAVVSCGITGRFMIEAEVWSRDHTASGLTSNCYLQNLVRWSISIHTLKVDYTWSASHWITHPSMYSLVILQFVLPFNTMWSADNQLCPFYHIAFWSFW